MVRCQGRLIITIGALRGLTLSKGESGMREMNTEVFELEISIEELEAKIAPDDNGETVLPLPKVRGRR